MVDHITYIPCALEHECIMHPSCEQPVTLQSLPNRINTTIHVQQLPPEEQKRNNYSDNDINSNIYSYHMVNK
jgi:hypothetical protein